MRTKELTKGSPLKEDVSFLALPQHTNIAVCGVYCDFLKLNNTPVCTKCDILLTLVIQY